MAKKRKDCFPYNIPSINDDGSFSVDRREIMKLTKMAKAWEFTCSFCFKKFPSAQAMGGHQNAHRSERLEERRLYVKDPIGYRKRAYILAMKEASEQGGPNPNPNPNPNHPIYLHADKPEVKFEINAAGIDYKSYFCQPRKIDGESDDAPFVVMNFLPPKELSLVESFGEDGEGKSCMELDVDGYGLMDLTLKL